MPEMRPEEIQIRRIVDEVVAPLKGEILILKDKVAALKEEIHILKFPLG